MLRTSLIVCVVVLVTACQALPPGVSSDPAERVSVGDRVQVEREMMVPAARASVILQNGAISSGSAFDRFSASCRFVMQASKSEVQSIKPGEFIVTQVRYWDDSVAPDYRIPLSGGEFVNYETTLRLHSEQQPAVHSLSCKHDDEHSEGRHLRRSEMQRALGNYARIVNASTP